jgi:hypothetical protein
MALWPLLQQVNISWKFHFFTNFEKWKPRIKINKKILSFLLWGMALDVIDFGELRVGKKIY